MKEEMLMHMKTERYVAYERRDVIHMNRVIGSITVFFTNRFPSEGRNKAPASVVGPKRQSAFEEYSANHPVYLKNQRYSGGKRR